MVNTLWDSKEKIVKKWYVKNGSILDVGCSKGVFLSRFDESIKVGIDINPNVKKIIEEKGIRFFCWDLTKEFYLGKSFDNIFCLDVLEHLPNPRNCIKSCFNSLKEKGLLFVSVPYWGFWKRLIAVLFHFDRIFGYETDHVRYYSPKALKTMLKESGFVIKKEYKIGRFYPFYMNYVLVCTKRLTHRL